ncbi:MAG: tetratricopeptide repeat protein [Steroidobacteraceae bacterium]
MFQLSPYLLAAAFVAVGIAAWLLGRHGGSRTVRLPRDYYVGLDHLINDRFDRAAEVFTRVAASNGDAAEIQFALGSLFRKRGEVDRAIAIHTRLREQGATAIRDQATFALALDFLGAGLMDRAERLLEELAASRDYRRDALEHLLRIYEQQGDWANALKIFHELPPELKQERRSVAAHYLCELAEHAILQGDMERARALLKQSKTHDAALPRAEILTARMLEAAGESRAAFDRYLRALESEPGLALEVIPRVLVLGRSLGEGGLAGDLCARLKRGGRLTTRQLEWLLATVLPPQDAAGLQLVAAGVRSVDAASGAARSLEAPSLGKLLVRIGEAGGRYQCEECGLMSVGWFWRCPKCRAWDGMQPAVFKWAERTDDSARAH